MVNRRAAKTKVLDSINTTQLTSAGVFKELQLACRNNNPSATKDALIKWGDSLGFETPVTSLSGLADLLGEPLAAEILRLNSHLYANGQQAWSGDSLLRTVQQFKPESILAAKNPDSLLKPLYYAFDK